MKTMLSACARGLFVGWLALLACTAPPALAAGPQVTITYLYDNTTAVAGAVDAWGFAALVEAHGKRVLFDTGGDATVLRRNVDALGVDLSRLDSLVLSHEHWDHTQGIAALGRRDGLPVFYPASSNASAPFRAAIEGAGMTPVPVTGMTSIAPRVMVSPEMQSPAAPEAALVVDTDDGVVIVVGCSHPGADNMVRAIRERTGKPVLMIVGGFHLLQSTSDEVSRTIDALKSLGVRYAGPTHCTGPAAIAEIRKAFGDGFIEGGVGTVVQAVPFRRTTVR